MNVRHRRRGDDWKHRRGRLCGSPANARPAPADRETQVSLTAGSGYRGKLGVEAKTAVGADDGVALLQPKVCQAGVAPSGVIHQRNYRDPRGRIDAKASVEPEDVRMLSFSSNASAPARLTQSTWRFPVSSKGAVGVSSNAASTGSSLRGKPGSEPVGRGGPTTDGAAGLATGEEEGRPVIGSAPCSCLAAGIRRGNPGGFRIRRRGAVPARVPPRRQGGSRAGRPDTGCPPRVSRLRAWEAGGVTVGAAQGLAYAQVGYRRVGNRC